MNLHELDRYKLSDAVKFNARLNPRLWGKDEHLKPQVRDALMKIADDFRESLGVKDLDLKDITLSGSNAAYTYTPNSDIDLHLVVDIPDDPVYRELFDAKKYAYNNQHNIKISGYDVELYVQDVDQPHVTQGEYSLIDNDWIQVPRRQRADVVDQSTRSKYQDLKQRIKAAIKTEDHDVMASLMAKIRQLRQSGLDQHGEFGPENLAFKMLRTQGYIQKLVDARNAAKDQELSIDERVKPRVTYGFATESKDSLSDTINQFARSCIDYLGIKKAPEIKLHTDTNWSEQTGSFGQYEPETNVLHLATSGRHTLDILRTMAHEFTHRKQAEKQKLPANAGETGSPYEDEANAMAGRIMRHWAEKHPEMFAHVPLEEASGYIPTKKQAKDPRFVMALTKDVRPGQTGKEANKLGLQTDAQGHPALLTARLNESLAVEDDRYGNQDPTGPESPPKMPDGTIKVDVSDIYDWYKIGQKISDLKSIDKKTLGKGPPSTVLAFGSEELENMYSNALINLGLKTHDLDEPGEEDRPGSGQDIDEALITETIDDALFEIKMSPSNLRQEAAKTGALAGMEFEMIVPNTEGGDDGDLEPDYDYDQRCRSIQDAYDFFYDGDFNGRRDVQNLREKMQEDYLEWLDEKIQEEWDSQGEEYIAEWVKNNVDESEWNPDDLEGDARNEALEEYSVNVHADPASRDYQSAYEEFREEHQEDYDESDWLDDADLSRMSEIENAYSMSWPHWRSQGGGEASIEDVAQEFENAIGRDVRASGNYHSGSVIRPSPTQIRYVVEPDGSLEPDDPNDQGLEFVSPPLPIDEILSDLNKVKQWAKEYGCYTNDSTGLHINISVPNYSRENLDFVKLALLMGDKYVLDAFGRSGNTYAKSAFDIVKRHVRDNPEEAAKLLDKMKGNLDQLATKAIHSGITSKYTSINTKDGHIEFRSPGGDWLDENFDQIENTLLRFTVAMSAALNPEMYRQEYLTKLYKLLSDGNKDVDTIKYFSDYVAGKIPRAALRSFVKQAQLERKLKRDPTGGERYWWRVYKEGRNAKNGAEIELVATSEQEAKDKAAKEWATTSTRGFDAVPVRPFDQTQSTGPTLNGRPSNPDGGWVISPENDRSRVVYRFAAASFDDANIVRRQWAADNDGVWIVQRDTNRTLGQPSSSQEQYRTGTYELFDRRTGEAVPDSEFPARNQSEMNTRLDDYINHGSHGMDTIDARLLFGVRPVVAPADEPGDVRVLDNALRPTGPGPWEIYNRATGNSAATLRVDGQPITDRAQAQRMAMGSIAAENYDRYGVRTIGTGSRANIGTQTDMENRLGLPSQSATANYAVVDRQTLDPVFRFHADDRRAANRMYGEWLAAAGLPQTTEDYGFQEIRPEIPEVPLDIEQNLPSRTDGRNIDYSFRDLFGTNATADQQQGGIVDVAPDVAQNFGGEFSGQWRILDGDTGTELFRFRSADPSQAEANRLARLWLQQNAPDSDFREIEVVPVMSEGIAEGSLEELANTSLKVKEPKNFVNTNDRKQVTYKVMKFKSGKDTYLINFTVKGPPAFGRKQNWNAVNVSFGVREPQDDYSFGDEINTDLTAKNKNQFLIYSTVINAIRKFITEYNTEIDEIIMQGAGERQEAMYQRFFQSAGKYFPGWHYDGKHSLVRDVPRQTGKKVREQGVTEGVNDYLWHGSKSKHDILYPQQANDTGGKKESNKNAVYATPSARVAIAMGLTTPGSDTGMFPNDPQMVLFKGGIRKGQMVYLHKVPKDLFIKHNDREWYSKPGVKEVKPIEVVTVPVDKWLHLIRQATPQDLELQKKNLKKQGIAESSTKNFVNGGYAKEFLGEYPSIETTLGEANDYTSHPDLVAYDKKLEKKLHRDIDVTQGQRKNLVPLDYDQEPEWSDVEYAQDYTGGSLDINDYLHRQYRKQTKPEEIKEFLKKIQALDRLLANHKLPQQIVVYTGLKQSPSDAWETYGADVSKPIRLHLPAYTSTTTRLKTALERVEDEVVQVPRARHKPRNKDAPKDDDDWGSQVLMITLPAGTPAGSVKKVSEYPDENEILLPRGMDIEINPRPTVLKGGDFVWHAQALGHNPVQIAPPMQENVADESLTEIAPMPAHHFAGGKAMLDYMPPPTKKHLKPLPGGTDLMYAIGPETRVQIVDPGIPGITRPDVVAALNLDSSNLPNTVQVGSITVDEDYRGRGLAKALYGIVLTIMRKNLVSGSGQTPGGRKNWMSLATIPGVEVHGLVRIPNQIFDLERTATVSPQWKKYADRTMDQIMQLGGQFYSKDNNSTYWLFDVVPGKGQLQPAVRNSLSRLYGYDADNLLLARWSGA